VAGCIAALGRPALAGRRATGDIYISPLGVYAQPGGYTPLFGPALAPRDVALQEGSAPRLQFRGLTKSSSGSFSTTLPIDLFTIAVPPGRETAARDLVARFQTEILPDRAAYSVSQSYLAVP
jgi:hypothetical protein